MPLLAFTLAALIGISLGLLGGGGSILTVPILVYALGFPAKEAIAMGLAVVGVVSLVGAWGHWRRGNVRPRAAVTFGAVAMAGTLAGAKLATFLSGATQLVLFAVVMLAAAFFMYRNAAGPGGGEREERRPAGAWLTALAAAAVGVMTGVAGVGGGFLIVPALVLFVGLPMKQAVGTSLVVIALNSFVGFAGYLGTVQVPWLHLGAFTAVAVLGIVAGTAVSHRVPQHLLKRAFSVFLVAMALFILFQNRDSFASSSAPITSTSAH